MRDTLACVQQNLQSCFCKLRYNAERDLNTRLVAMEVHLVLHPILRLCPKPYHLLSQSKLYHTTKTLCVFVPYSFKNFLINPSKVIIFLPS